MNPIAVGILLNSALYLGGCVAAGIITGNGIAWRLGLAAMGMTYVGYALQLAASRVAKTAVFGSMFLGVAAGLSLLLRW